MKRTIFTALSIFLIALVVASFAAFVYVINLNNQDRILGTPPPASKVNVSTIKAKANNNADNIPVRIEVHSASISLNVIAGYYDTQQQTWTSSTTSALYATPTSLPNQQSGNTLVYAHNRPNLFGRLDDATLGSIARLYTKDGTVFTYMLQVIRDTDPDDVSVFTNQGEPTLTLQTCSGLFLQNRRMFIFSLEKSDQITKNYL